MHPKRFIGFAWNVGEPITFKVLQCNSDPHKRNIIFHRGVFVLGSITSTGYNSALAPNRDAYLPSVQVEGGPHSKTIPSEHQSNVNPPNSSTEEGGGKRHKPSSSPSDAINHAGADRPSVDSNEAAVDGPGTTNGFPDLANRGDVNGNGTSYDMDWDAMEKRRCNIR